MSQQIDYFKLENCISSKLWFTSYAIHRIKENDNNYEDSDAVNLFRSIGEYTKETSWIVHKLFTILSNSNEDKVNKWRLNSIQLRDALYLIDKNVPEIIVEELLKLHDAIAMIGDRSEKISLKMSTASLEFLKINFWHKPALVQWIIDQLLCIWCSSFYSSDSSLQDLYVNVINEILTSTANTLKINNNQSIYSTKNINFIDEQHLGILLCILSKFNITELKEHELNDWLWSKLIKVCEFKDVELAFYSRKDQKYFKMWHNYLDKIFGRNEMPDNYENAQKISSAVFQFYQNSPVFLNTNELFIRLLRHKTHWLSDIIDVIYILTINNQLNDVAKILNNPIFNCLWLPFLFIILNDSSNTQIINSNQLWKNYTSFSTALRFIIENCKVNSCDDSVMLQLENTLENHLNVLNWIVKCKNCGIESDKLTLNHQSCSIKQIFRHLQSSSVLATIKTFVVDVHDKCYDEIDNLLPNDDGTKNIYQAYYAMLSGLKAILLCHSYNTEFVSVADHYGAMEKHLNNLHPMNLRLEVIENIFSMLFLRHEDFLVTDNTSYCEEDDVDNEKNLSTPRNNSSQYQTGFICNKFAIRETLHYLGRCVFVASNYLSKSKENLISHDNVKDLEQRILTVQNYLTEAAWRLKLLTNIKFFEDQGLPDLNVNNLLSTNKAAVANIHSQNESKFYKIDEYSSDEMDFRSDLDVSSESSLINNVNQQNSKRRRRLKNNNSVDELLDKKDLKKAKEFTLNYMLASEESLVLRCLWKDDFEEAQRIIEMFNMGNSSLAGEIIFSRAMRIFRDDIAKQLAVASPQYFDTDKLKVDCKHSTLDFIRKAARDGIQASRTTSQVETFLASQESNILICSHTNNAKEIMALTTVDVALTMGHNAQISECLSDVAMKHLRSCKKLENTPYYEFFEKIYQLYYEKKDMSIVEIISNAKVPLSLKEQRDYNEYWSSISKKLKEFEIKIKFIDSIDKQHVQDEMNNEMHKISSIYGNGEPYLPRIIIYIQLLRSITSQFDETIKLNMNSSLLENSIDFYMGYQIFDLDMDLEVLETIANQLQINFLYSILTNCCPKFLCCNNDDITNNDIQNVNDQWGILVLNKYKDSNNDEFIDMNSHDPNQCVVEILEELMKIMENFSFTSSVIWEIDRKKYLNDVNDIKKILRKTQCLINLDLSHLSFGNHTLVFFLNIWNLMMLHAITQVWSINPPFNDLQHAISLTTLGYEIGDLGLVTLFTLRKKLLGESLCNMNIFDFKHAVELNEPAWQDLDLQQDFRVIFAMINEYKATPIIKIYYPETLNDDLYNAANDYLNYYANNQDVSTLKIPRLVEKYKNFIANTEEINTILDKFLNNDKTIDYEPFEYLYDIELIYKKINSINFNWLAINKDSNSDTITWTKRKIKQNLLQYLKGHCWLFSYIVQRIHETNPTLLDSNCINIDRTSVLENLLNSQWIQNIKSLFNDNTTVAGLWKCLSTNELWREFDINLNANNFEMCLTIIDALPDSLVMTNVEIQSFRDKILAYFINNKSYTSENEILQYLYQIKNVKVLAQIVLANVKEWPVNICEDALRHVLNHVNKNCLPVHCRAHINEILCRVMVFDKILPYYNAEDMNNDTNWYNIVYHTEKTDPICIVKSLIDSDQHELCLKWLEYQTASSEIQSLVSQDLFVGLLKNEKDNFQHARKLLQALPINLSVKLCKGVIERLESMNALKFVVNYLLENCPMEQEKYRCSTLGVDILNELDARDRGLYINLIDSPLLMLEQLLMNGKFDSLQRIITNHMDNLKFADIPIEDFDQLVRFYAKKSLDSRVAIQRDIIDGTRSKDTSLNDSGEFIMPINTPTKDEWIPNDKTRECSCCKVVTFSMFNRRHHCRRCGRVVCASCSSQRMRVYGYADSVLVRVCNDCKRQTVIQAQGPSSTPSSETFDCWRLTHDETHNRTLREEFCFEYAPNISLCLAILDLHSDHKAYANFLLDQCDEMKKLLSPDSKGRINPEIDHCIIISMIRSLLFAAKVKYAKLGLNMGLADCDRFLSQVDLISTLVQSDCLSLIPSDDLNDHTFRRLRDLLTEKEQWILALDLSTKSGLDTQGVWAAWGKACLKVGYYEGAREKFSHCLEKVNQEDFDDWVFLPHSDDVDESVKAEQDREKKELKMNEAVKNRPSKDSPLLLDILQILEVSNSTNEYPQELIQTTNTAQDIVNTLNNLKAISHGQYTISKLNCSTKNFRYQESLYYLLMYGSFNSILEFFVRYGELDKCLSYVLENDIEPELFFNIIFFGCLKSGTLENLCTAMKSKDSSLLLWKKYLICICHNLEKKQLLNTLYQIQLFMRDYIRAAMTCIRFYVTDASNYIDICSRNHFLIDAQKHLETELQVESFGKRRRKSTTSMMSGHSSFTMEMEPSEIDRHINTISRQMEIAKFLGACEKEGRSVNEFLSKLSFMDSEGLLPRTVPTLFGNQQERTHLSVLAILCGHNVEEGFGIAFRVMQDYNLRSQKVYSLVGHILALDRKINSIEQLIKCCRSSGAPNSNAISDRVLVHCIKFLLDRLRTETTSNSKDEINSLIRIITDVELKIGCYIESKQLKAAYLLAVKHSRAQDIRRILKEADRLGQPAIKSICTKWLQQTQQNQ